MATKVEANPNSWIPNSSVIQEDILGSKWTHDGSSETNATASQDVDTKMESGLSTHSNNIISELFGISLKTYKDFEEFINNIELGKSEVWLEVFEAQCQEVFDAFGTLFRAFKAEYLDDNITNNISPSDPIV
ncbi:hypothetical protein Tco_1206318 [Tanacetum coccineum]